MRKFLFLAVIISICLLFLSSLFYVQVLESDEWQLKAELNSVKAVYDYPERGFIYDRYGNLMVANQVAYDVMVVPREVKDFDTLQLSKLLRIDKAELEKRLLKAQNWSYRQPSVVVPQLTQKEYAPLQERLRRFPGFYVQRKSLRDYQVDHSASVLGYIREVSRSQVESDPYYQSGDLRGKSGIENYYEELLRGKKGVKRFLRDKFGRQTESYKKGRYDSLPVAGADLTLTLNADLQAYGEKLMLNKRGGIVAIEPATGEILSLITAPNYDPAILMGRDRSRNVNAIIRDTIRMPDMNRALQAEYSPGSPFKVINALVGLQEGVVKPSEKFSCNRGYQYSSRRRLGCHPHSSPLSMERGIAESCNAYFGQVYRRIIENAPTSSAGMDKWHEHVSSFGLGDYLGYDLPVGRPGLIPTGKYYDNNYQYKWYAPATISNAIGQGEVITTPIQLANMTAAIANRGYYHTPHILKKVNGKEIDDPRFTARRNTTIDTQHFDPVIDGMAAVYTSGTGKRVQIPGIEICGKTGTVENFAKVNGKRTQLTDHSVFIAFAPKDDPQIAIAVFIENGYWGSRYAAKIASLMIEKHIKGEITRTDLETYLLTHSLEKEYDKPYLGVPFEINPEFDDGLIDPEWNSVVPPNEILK